MRDSQPILREQNCLECNGGISLKLTHNLNLSWLVIYIEIDFLEALKRAAAHI
jgi:hypothetical protein